MNKTPCITFDQQKGPTFCRMESSLSEASTAAILQLREVQGDAFHKPSWQLTKTWGPTT